MDDYFGYDDDLAPLRAPGAAPSGPFARKWARLNKVLSEVLDDYRLVAFCTLNISEPASVLDVVRRVDKSNGYAHLAAAGHTPAQQEAERQRQQQAGGAAPPGGAPPPANNAGTMFGMADRGVSKDWEQQMQASLFR